MSLRTHIFFIPNKCIKIEVRRGLSIGSKGGIRELTILALVDCIITMAAHVVICVYILLSSSTLEHSCSKQREKEERKWQAL